LEIKSGECHIWCFESNEVTPDLVNILSKEEKTRYSNYKFIKDKNRFLKSASMLRILLSLYTGISLENLLISRKCNDCDKNHGKPTLINCREINFSISYSKNIVVIGIYKNFEIGVDIEWIDYDFPYEEVIQSILTPEELKKHNGMGPNEKLKNFYFHWTIKESLTKATGQGLNESFNNISIEQNTNYEAIEVVNYPGYNNVFQTITIKSMMFKENYMLSLAVFDSLKTIKFYNENEISEYTKALGYYSHIT